MTEPGHEDLLGYLLGALEPHEQRRVERALEQDPALRQRLDELARYLEPMDDVDSPAAPPPGLARRACEAVANADKAKSGSGGGIDRRRSAKVHGNVDATHERIVDPSSPVAGAFGSVIEARRKAHAASPQNRASLRPGLNATNEIESRSSSWSASELLIAAASCLIVGAFFFPSLLNSRHQARIAACQDNLRQIGMGLHSYSDSHLNYFPQVSRTGNLAVAGSYGPRLHDMGLLPDEMSLICPSSPLADERADFDLPSCQQIESFQGLDAAYWRERMGGSYAFAMGYVSDGKYHSHINRYRANFVILADAPDLSDVGRRSRNHSGQGQNVVCEDLTIKYLRDCSLSDCDTNYIGDLFFVNRNGMIAAGVDEHDSVVGSSAACPFIPYPESQR